MKKSDLLVIFLSIASHFSYGMEKTFPKGTLVRIVKGPEQMYYTPQQKSNVCLAWLLMHNHRLHESTSIQHLEAKLALTLPVSELDLNNIAEAISIAYAESEDNHRTNKTRFIKAKHIDTAFQKLKKTCKEMEFDLFKK